ncbi:MAG: dihydroorotate dehydrogenase (quinone), partial [Nanoarchaeota archaeon]
NLLLSKVYKFKIKNKKSWILIGSGGIFSAEDAYKKIKLGANLVQLITGMIYKGPALIGQINQGLVYLLKKEGYSNIREVVGKAY